MAGISLHAVERMPDPLTTARFELSLMPNSGNNEAARILKIRCQTMDFPGFTIEPVPWALHGFEGRVRGRLTYEGTLSSAFSELVTGEVYRSLSRLQQKTVGSTSGNGTYLDEYSFTGEIGIVDNYGRVALALKLHRMWLSSIAAINLDGQTAGLALVNTTWSYDRPELIGETLNGYGEEPTE